MEATGGEMAAVEPISGTHGPIRVDEVETLEQDVEIAPVSLLPVRDEHCVSRQTPFTTGTDTKPVAGI
ncbi:MAG: hypothetical protein DBO99_09910 [gamma proteobacterium symbiont of Ctena orbiculata]|nr:MAG: hypothetical protein DBO99_09910 [gamma proteobacterium symbiont of Ctena orbiculata]